MMKRAYKYRFYPTSEQKALLTQTFGCVRFIYNSILRWRTDAYYNKQQKIGYTQASGKLTQLKKQADLHWLNDVSCVPLQQGLRHQQAAFKNFFEGRAKYPTFKKKHFKQSAEFTRSAFKYRDNQLFLAKSKTPLDIRWSQTLPSEPSTITVSKDRAGRYFVSCLCEFEPTALPVSPKTVGIDLGLHDLFVTDTGQRSDNPKYTRKYEQKLVLLQRRLAKKKLGSNNRSKARQRVACLHAKIADTRKDHLHKLSRKLINENQVVCAESLNIKNMAKNPKLAKSISDASWGELLRQLSYKAQWAGRDFVQIDQFFPSSKRCFECGHVVDSLPLSVRDWHCPSCQSHNDRDINAAKNIKAVGHTVLAFGENVSLDKLRA